MVKAPLLAAIASLAKPVAAEHHESSGSSRQTCSNLKELFQAENCCGNPTQEINFMTIPNPSHRLADGANPCEGQKSITYFGFNNTECFTTGQEAAAVLEQSGADVTSGYSGTIANTMYSETVGGAELPVTPETRPYWQTGMCPVNVHWHLGAEHRSEGQYDEMGTGPEGQHDTSPATTNPNAGGSRRLPGEVRYGYACRHYDETESKFTTPYEFKYCSNMHVGETYEVHWPHSAFGACGSPYQYQEPFYDGVFCTASQADLQGILGSSTGYQDVASSIGVQAQVFTIVNDEHYYYPDLMRGMIYDAHNGMGVDITAYTGSTTGTSRSNTMCSNYAPITWQVDRRCHLISASSFDKMCADMKQQSDSTLGTGDTHPHGARELVLSSLAAQNHADVDHEAPGTPP